MEKRYYIFWVCVCSLSYPARNAHASFSSVDCSAPQTFSALSHKRQDCPGWGGGGGALLNTKSVFFSETFAWNISHKNWARYDQNRILVCRYSTSYSCPNIMELEYSRLIFEKYSNIRPPLWSSGQSFWLQIQRSRVRSPALPDFLSSLVRSNWGATWIKK